MTKLKGLMAHIFLKNEQAVSGFDNLKLFGDGNAFRLAKFYEHRGADALIIFDLSVSEKCHFDNLHQIREMCRRVNIPILVGGNVHSLDDIGRLLEMGCHQVVLSMSEDIHRILLPAAAEKFGKDKIVITIQDFSNISEAENKWKEYTSLALLMGDSLHLYDVVRKLSIPSIPIVDKMDFQRICTLLHLDKVVGISGNMISNKNINLFDMKEQLESCGIHTNSNSSAIPWSEFKLNSDGMIPVIVQDYKTDEVLMLAYMNEEAFAQTIKTGIMTYWSRSRQELWVKGDTSGHYQYVKRLSIDCDNDTLLAKVSQVGAACHTGNHSCFYRDLMKKNYREENTISILDTVYQSIAEQNSDQYREEYKKHMADAAFVLMNSMVHAGISIEELSEEMAKKYLKNREK